MVFYISCFNCITSERAEEYSLTEAESAKTKGTCGQGQRTGGKAGDLDGFPKFRKRSSYNRRSYYHKRKEVKKMKEGIHPNYYQATVTCNCGNTFVTGSTKKDIHVEICSKCHPFYTGQQKAAAARGRIDKFNKKYGINA